MRLKIQTIITVAAILLLISIPTSAQTSNDPVSYPEGPAPWEKDAPAEDTVDEGDEEAADEEELSEFDALIEDLEVIEGLFTFYRDEEEGTVYMSIKPEQLDVIYLLSPTLESGTGEGGLWGAMMWNEKPIIFHKEPGQIQIIEINTLFRADDEKITEILERMYSDSVLRNVPIEAEHEEDGTILINLGTLLLTDFLGISPRINYWIDPSNSKIGTLKAFPLNVNISAILIFMNEDPPESKTLPDARSMRVEIRYDISERPNTGYMPRYADPRVGYFVTTFKDYTDDKDPERYKYYANRWHVEKKYPNKLLSPPKEPVVFWLENTIPEQYRPAIRDGIQMWNDAFERIGIKDAIEARDMPDDAEWDPADVRYNTIRWYSASDAFFAIGPSRVDPFTGQIYDADIGISIDFPRGYYINYLRKIGVLEEVENLIPSNGRLDPSIERRLGEISMLGNVYAMNVLTVRGLMEPGSKGADEYTYGALKALICHEVGHTLGLRHNFKASRSIPTKKLHDVSFTSVHGITSSIMEYDVPNIAPPGVEQGEYHHSSIGDYDRWAIEYGYSIFDAETPEDELPALEEIASRGAERFHLYGTDEDAHAGTWSMDPECIAWDMGDDPFKYYEGSLATTKELWDKLEDYWDKPGTDYKWLTQTYMSGFFEYWMMGRTIKRYVGSIKHNRYRIGDPNSDVPYVPTPGNIQRKALRFLNEHLWAADVFNFDAELVNKLGNPRFYGFDWSVNLSPHDYPIHANVLLMQGHTLEWIYDPVVMTRLVDMRYKYPDGVEPFYLEDMFVYVRNAIWSEVNKTENINSFRRNLQRFHLDILINLVVAPLPGTPDDARALARMDLVTLADSIKNALATTSLDYITRAHLSEVQARINAALDADIFYWG